MMKGTKLLLVALVMSLMSAALLITNSGFKLTAGRKSPAESRLLIAAADDELFPEWTTTPGPSRTNLKGKMFTLSSDGEGIRFYPPHFSGSYSTNETPTTRPRTTRPPTTHYWTTAPPYTGVSVCLRYLADPQRDDIRLFTLSPSSSPLRLSTNSQGTYTLPLQTYPYAISMTPSIRLWTNIDPEMWTRVCLVVDNTRNVVQLFSGPNMSIRRIMSSRYVWSGEPVIDIPGFDGQVTDIQVWDYPLRYKEVFNYMTNGVYVSYRGSVISWSSISYSIRGKALLEDIYEKQASQPISSSGRGRGRRPKGERKLIVVFKEGESGERNNQWFK